MDSLIAKSMTSCFHPTETSAIKMSVIEKSIMLFAMLVKTIIQQSYKSTKLPSFRQ